MKRIKRIIGVIMFVAPFAALFYFAGIRAGFIVPIALFGIPVGLMGWIGIACWLLNEDDKSVGTDRNLRPVKYKLK